MATMCCMTKVAKNGNFIDLNAATNGNYLLYDKSCQKWQLMCCMTQGCQNLMAIFIDLKVAKNGNYFASLAVVAKNGNYLLYDRSCQKWQ